MHSLFLRGRGSVAAFTCKTASARPSLMSNTQQGLRSQGSVLIRSSVRPMALGLSYRAYSSQGSLPRSQAPSFKRVWLAVALLLGLAGGIKLTVAGSKERHPPHLNDDDNGALAHVPWSGLIRHYVVYALCSSAKLVEWSPTLMDWCRSTSLPLVNRAFEWFMAHTLYAQFVGGPTAEACRDMIKHTSMHAIGAILAYSAEVEDQHVTPDGVAGIAAAQHAVMPDDPQAYLYMDKVREKLHSIQVAGQCNAVEQERSRAEGEPSRAGSVMIAVKLSGLLRDANVLERASAAIMPREHFIEPPTTTPPTDANIARGGQQPGLTIPVASLSPYDVGAVTSLWHALRSMAREAQINGGVRILVDAEYSWYQPAIDALFESCAREFNQINGSGSRDGKGFTSWLPWGAKDERQDEPSQPALPLLYNTYQAYLRRTPAYLVMSMERARVGNYSLGVKLVRGAYVDVEAQLWEQSIVPTPPGMDQDAIHARNHVRRGEWRSPFWPSKALTDECYDLCADWLVERVGREVSEVESTAPAKLAIVLAGHNVNSALTVVRKMIKTGLALPLPTAAPTNPDSLIPYHGLQLQPGVRGRIHLAQLYGMADDLTHAVRCAFDPYSGGDGPHLTLKYIPYGNLALVMPYLSRRAQENKSVMGSGRSAHERAMIRAEMWRRIKATFARSSR